MKKRFITVGIFLAALFMAGCSGIGPKTITRDRFNYNTEISDSWKEQTLLNIVKLRYADMPLFVDVASVVNGYSLEQSVDLGAQLRGGGERGFFTLGSGGTFTDRPTITYSPITGQKFNQSFLTPIPPRAVLFLMQTGWPVDVIFPLTVDVMNGLRSRVPAGANMREGDPEFYRSISLFRKIQKSGAVGMRIIKGEDQKDATVIFFYRKNLDPEIKADLYELNNLLGLSQEEGQINVTYDTLAKNNREIAMLTRSMLHIMINLAARVNVPESHIASGLTPAALKKNEDGDEMGNLIDIKCSLNKPEKAHCAVHYKDHWFWIDDGDFRSKRTFTILMILFSMMESGAQESLPLVTIPAG